MVGWAFLFLLFSLIAGIFGFGGVAGTAADIAMILFWVGVVLFVITCIAGIIHGKGQPGDIL